MKRPNQLTAANAHLWTIEWLREREQALRDADLGSKYSATHRTAEIRRVRVLLQQLERAACQPQN